MLKSGAEHLKSLRDGRVVYVGGERVDDVESYGAELAIELARLQGEAVFVLLRVEG